MSLGKLSFFKTLKKTSEDHSILTDEKRHWEDAYRDRYRHDKVVRSTHGVNCTGSCSWEIYVKNGIVVWEIQKTDYPRTRPDLPNHEPRGCQRGASYSWYLYSATRLKYPLIRGTIISRWRQIRQKVTDPVLAWEMFLQDKSYKAERGNGGFVRSSWDEVNEIIAAANVYTVKKHGPDRIIGFSPIPAMSMVSYAAGSRYLSLIGGVCMSFYDWYCDLPPSSPQTWGEQTDVPESADWYNSGYIIAWGSNVPQTRTPDAHFFTEVRYKGTKTVAVTPDYSEVAKLSDLWLAPKQGTDAALALAMGHVILKEYYVDKQYDYFIKYAKSYTDMPFLVKLESFDSSYTPGQILRASDVDIACEENPDSYTCIFDKKTNSVVIPSGTIGSRWAKEKGKWNLKSNSVSGVEIDPVLSVNDVCDGYVDVLLPYFASNESHKSGFFSATNHSNVIKRKIPVKILKTSVGDVKVTTIFDLLVANYGVDRGFTNDDCAKSFDEDMPYTPKWQEAITGVKKEAVIKIAREFADNAVQTQGKSMVIVGAALNHWYHMDMTYRGIIYMLMMCGCVGQSGGGWAHYVGQEKLRPQSGWAPLAFGADWVRPPRQMNSTSFFYSHTSQWKYEKLGVSEIISPLADKKYWENRSLIDCNVKAERLGWLPSAPQLEKNPINLCKESEKIGESDVKKYVVDSLKNGSLKMSCEDPDAEVNFPRNMFIWRSNLLGSSGKGHEYFLKYLLGTNNGVQGKDLGKSGEMKPSEVKWHDNEVTGKLDLLVTLDFRMSTTCLYSDIVLPTASWYEKNDMNTSDMHPFIHPLTKAVDPVYESRSDWEIFKGIAKEFSRVCRGHLDIERDVVLQPLLHDTQMEIAQGSEPKDWKKGECDLIPGKTMPNIVVVERDYPNTYKRFTSFGPLLEKLGNNGKGISWNTEEELHFLKQLNGVNDIGNIKIDSDVDACELILSLAPETNGSVALKSWEALGETTGLDHTHLARPREDDKIRFHDIVAQPRKIISSPIWSGIESEHVSYNACYTNVHEYIPWRTLTGRQQFYLDHKWMRDFGESLCVYKPPIDTRTLDNFVIREDNGNKEIALNFITPHQKWGIHSTYSDNLIMLTLNRGGPVIWLSEEDAKAIDVVDNDWIEAYNVNGSITARAVVSQRVPNGMVLMYHAQEKIINVPLSENTKLRGGIHNSVTRATVKPTHMIGGYAQFSYGFNYYGTVGSNRDEFVIVRKMKDVKFY